MTTLALLLIAMLALVAAGLVMRTLDAVAPAVPGLDPTTGGYEPKPPQGSAREPTDAAPVPAPPPLRDPGRTGAAPLGSELHALRLQVRAATTNLPAAQVRLRVTGPDGRARVLTTDPDGRCATDAEFPACCVALALALAPEAEGLGLSLVPELVALPVEPCAAVAADGYLQVALVTPRRAAVQVRQPGGGSVAGAEVGIVGLAHPGMLSTGADGLAWLLLPEGPLQGRTVRCAARLAAAGLISDECEFPLDGAAPGTRLGTLLLLPGAQVVLQVVDDQGAPVSAARCVAQAAPGAIEAPLFQRHALTTSGGRCSVAGLPPGRWQVWAEDSRREPACSPVEILDLLRGGTATAVLALGPVVLQERVGLAGRVVDASGRGCPGVPIWFTSDDGEGWSGMAETAADGSFASGTWLEGFPRAIKLWTVQDGLGSGAEPRQLTVPFGTCNVLLRVAAEVRPTRVSFQVLDAETGEVLRDAALERWLPDARRWEAVGTSDVRGLVQITERFAEPARFRLCAPGYRTVERNLRGGSEAAWHLRVELPPGTFQEVMVTDARTEAAMAGVEAWIGRHLVGTTDAQGRVCIDSPLRAREVHLRKPGYAVAVIWPRGSHCEVQLSRAP